MGIVESLFKASLYFGMFFFIYQYIKGKCSNKIDGNAIAFKNESILSMSVFQMLIISFAFGLYSIYITAPELTHDRMNYAFSFRIERKLTPAMNFIFDIIRKVTDNPKVIFFFISFLMLFLLLVACKVNTSFRPRAFLLMSVSNLLIFSYNGLKQAPAIGFIAIAVSLVLSKRYIFSIGCAIIAILFHESALIFFPMFFLLLGAKKRWIRTVEYVGCLLFLVAFPKTTQILVDILKVSRISVIEEMGGYLDVAGGIAVDVNILTAFKGIPYYLIAILGIVLRKKMKKEIDNYDKYLVMSVFTAVVYMLSIYMYFMWRLAIYFYFFDFVFAAQLVEKCKNKKLVSSLFYVILIVLGFISVRYYLQYFINFGGF